MLKGGNRESWKLPWLTVLTGAVVILIHWAPDYWGRALQLDRSLIGLGTFWQLFTAHLTHWNASHLIWDVAMFGMVGTLVEMRSRSDWLMTIAVSAFLIPISVLLLRPDLQYYRGLSGLDMALAGYWLATQFQECRTKGRLNEKGMWAIALVLLLAKPLVELASGEALFVSDLGAGIENVALAHFVGALVGLSVCHCLPCTEVGTSNRHLAKLFKRILQRQD